MLLQKDFVKSTISKAGMGPSFGLRPKSTEVSRTLSPCKGFIKALLNKLARPGSPSLPVTPISGVPNKRHKFQIPTSCFDVSVTERLSGNQSSGQAWADSVPSKGDVISSLIMAKNL